MKNAHKKIFYAFCVFHLHRTWLELISLLTKSPKRKSLFINLWIFIYDFSMLIIIMAFVLVIFPLIEIYVTYDTLNCDQFSTDFIRLLRVLRFLVVADSSTFAAFHLYRTIEDKLRTRP